MSTNNLLIILGSTASGKTNLAVNLAHQLNAEIISADSRQVFRGMDIGTGKDLEEYVINGKFIPHHLINIKSAGERYQVNAFKEDFYQAFTDITLRKKLPILCGGTGMYIHSILQNHELTAVPINATLRAELEKLSKEMLLQRLATYPQQSTAHADLNSAKRLIRAIEVAEFLEDNTIEKVQRPTLNPLVIGLYNEVEQRRQKIMTRLNHRLQNGLIEEVQQLLANGVSEEMLVFYGLEYKFVVAYLKGHLDLDMLFERLGTAICQFAKRQMTFFRKMEKDGVVIHWIEASEDKNAISQQVISLLSARFNLK